MKLLFLCFFLIAFLKETPTCVVKKLSFSNSLNYCSELALRNKLKKGILCLLKTDQVKPTQSAVGQVVVRCVIKKIEKSSAKSLKKFIRKQIVPTVLGPNNTFYITDKHHLAKSLFDASFAIPNPTKYRVLVACIHSDFSMYSDNDTFWEAMQETGNVYLQDYQGRNITWKQLPLSLKMLEDDPYRSLARWIRNSNGFIKCTFPPHSKMPQCKKEVTPFYIEFLWANFFREAFPSPYNEESYPFIHPTTEKFIYRTDYKNQALALKQIYHDCMRASTDPVTSSHLLGFNMNPDILKPIHIHIDKNGCDSENEG